MPPFLALILWVIFLVALLRFDPARIIKPSPALWVPLIWLFIVGSRLPAVWIGGQVAAGGSLEDGNPVDRVIFLILILTAIGTLVSRSFQWGDFFVRNYALTAFLLLALVSVAWSDFPFISFKRWFRDLGHYLVILVVLSDRNPVAAIATVLRRLSFVLISLSVLLIKYFPEKGVSYDYWTGVATYCGATTSKYMLAIICLVSGLYFFWDTITRWPDRKRSRTKPVIYVNILFIGMVLWVLNLADGATCTVCLVIGCMVILVSDTSLARRNPGTLKVMIPVAVCALLFLLLGTNIKSVAAPAVGRDASFTDRTVLWTFLLGMKINPILGTGYESFWLGSRLAQITAAFPASRPIQAHNGYLRHT